MTRRCGVLLGLALLWAGAIATASASSRVGSADKARSGVKPSSASQPSGDRLVQVATLTASNPMGSLSFDGVAISGKTIVAHSSQYPASGPPGSPDTGVYVFTEPAGGWWSETAAALLTAANGEGLGPVAVSGRTVVAGASAIGSAGPGAAYVFSQPAGGWSGTLHESAKLTPSDGGTGTELGHSVAVSGQTAFAAGSGAVYVFTEPASGWSGELHESAKLTASDGASLTSLAVSGDTVVAGGGGAVYVFNQPPRGWTGTLHEAAKLTASDAASDVGGDFQFGHSVAVSGQTVVAGASLTSSEGAVYVFTKPAGGWSGTLHQRAELRYPADDYTLPGSVAVSGQVVAAIADEPGVEGVPHECPCDGSVYAVTEPSSGWAGTSTVSRSASVSTGGVPEEIGIDGQTLIVGSEDGVHVFTTIAPATAGHVSLTGMATRTPRFRVQILAGANGPSIKSFTIKPSHNLGFSRNRTQLADGVQIAHANKYKLSLKDGDLTVALRRPARAVSVTIAAPALTEAVALVKRVDRVIRFNRSRKHQKKRAMILKLTLLVTDAARNITSLTLRASVA
jgi:FG-GAP repeat